jgi:heat shock protein HtpX
MGFGSRRVMGLGLPLLSILTVSQFRAVLAHEFAHYYGGDTSLGPWVYRTQTAMVRIFQNIGSVGKLARIAILGVMYLVVATLMKWYFVVFMRAINLASRRREFRADELACIIAGRQPLIDGLRAIHGASLAWPTYWRGEIVPVLNDGFLPGIGEGFARFVSVPPIHEQIQKGIEKAIQEAKTNPYDTHPPLRERIAATRNLANGLIYEDSNPARTLLDHPDATELRFLESVNPDMKPQTVRCVSWDEVGTKVTIPHWKKFAAEYASHLQGVTAESLPSQVANFPKIGDSMRDPKGMLLGPEERTRRAGQLFGIALALALLDRGWILNVGPGVFFLHTNHVRLNPFQIVDQLMTGKLSAQDWSAQSRSLGIADFLLNPSDAQLG